MPPQEYNQSIEMLRKQFPAFQQYEKEQRDRESKLIKEWYQKLREHAAASKILLDAILRESSPENREMLCHRMMEDDEKLIERFLADRKP